MANGDVSKHAGVSMPMRLSLPMAGTGDSERSDATRNRALLLAAARRLIDDHGAAEVTMDAVAREAGVGKGTVFRRFGDRAGLMMALLDQSETEIQRAIMTGPPPLGSGAPPRERLLAYGHARLRMVCAHLDILIEADDAAGPRRLLHPAHRVAMVHVETLLRELGFHDAVAVIALALLAPLEAASVHHLMSHVGLTVEQIADQWTALALSLTPA